MSRRDVSTADLLYTGLCYDDVIESLDASGGKITATYDEALAVMILWSEQSGREGDLQDGIVWLREHFDETPAARPRRPWWTSRSKFGCGRPRSFIERGLVRPERGVALLQNRRAGRGHGRA